MINKSATPALSFQMPGKTITLAVAVFFLSIALHSACFGATLPKLPVDLTKTLDERCNERILTIINRLQDEQQKRWSRASRLMCNHSSHFNCWHARSGWYRPVKMLDLPIPPRSKHRLPDDPINALTTAFQTCTNLKTLIIGPSSLTEAHFDDLFVNNFSDRHLFPGETNSSDAFVARFVYQLLFRTLQPMDQFDWFPKESAQEEIDNYKHLDFAPTLIFEFEGENWLRVELDTEGLQAIIRTKDQWGAYTLDRQSAIAIESRVNDLQTLCVNPPIDE